MEAENHYYLEPQSAVIYMKNSETADFKTNFMKLIKKLILSWVILVNILDPMETINKNIFPINNIFHLRNNFSF